jgi:hypothetical protein
MERPARRCRRVMLCFARHAWQGGPIGVLPATALESCTRAGSVGCAKKQAFLAGPSPFGDSSCSWAPAQTHLPLLWSPSTLAMTPVRHGSIHMGTLMLQPGAHACSTDLGPRCCAPLPLQLPPLACASAGVLARDMRPRLRRRHRLVDARPCTAFTSCMSNHRAAPQIKQ